MISIGDRFFSALNLVTAVAQFARFFLSLISRQSISGPINQVFTFLVPFSFFSLMNEYFQDAFFSFSS